MQHVGLNIHMFNSGPGTLARRGESIVCAFLAWDTGPDRQIGRIINVCPLRSTPELLGVLLNPFNSVA